MAKSSVQLKTVLIVVAGFLLTVFMGIFVALFGAAVGDHYGVLIAIPAAMIVGILFFVDRYTLFMLILVSRASLDPVLEATRFGSFGLGAVLNTLIIIMALIAMTERNSQVFKVIKQTWLPFLTIVFLTLFFAPNFSLALKTFLSFLSYASIFALAIAVIKTENDYGRWIRAIFFSSFVPVIYAFIQLANGGYVGHESEGLRVSSTFAHPNIFAFYLVLMISLSFNFYKTQATYIPSSIRRVLPIYIFILIALLLLTKTRSAWVSFAAFFTLYALFYERKYLLYILLAGISIFMIPEMRDRISDLAQGNEVVNYSALNSYAWRKLIWHDGLSFMNPSHYFLGYGIDAFKIKSVDFFTMSGGREAGAHSVFVQLFFETGAFGLAAYIWLHFQTAKLLIPYYKKNKLMIFTMVMTLLEFAFEAYADNMLDYLSYTWYLWFVLGATYALTLLQPAETKKSELNMSNVNLKPR